jgi:hypothetical protein
VRQTVATPERAGAPTGRNTGATLEAEERRVMENIAATLGNGA